LIEEVATMAKKVRKPERGIVERLFSEHVLCGGQLYTRKQLFDELLAEGFPRRQADAFAFGYLKAVTIELIEDDRAMRHGHDLA
jgi:hypothetical protein